MPAASRTPSALRIAASRANGAHSRGPITPAGKACSCRNATRHGLFSRNPLPIPAASLDLRATINEFLRFYPNPDPAERAILHQLALSRCQLRLAIALETQWIDEAIPAAGSIPEAFAAIADTPRFRMILRLEGRASRTFHSLLVTLLSRCKSKNDGTNPSPRPPSLPNPAPAAQTWPRPVQSSRCSPPAEPSDFG